jgi:acetoacetyl-CoA reductase
MRVAVITGGMGGLGDSISTKMHAAGYRVAVTHSPGNTKTKEWLSQHKASGREFSAYPVDVADFESCKECVARIAKEVGPVDILINNAGITRDTTFKKMSKGDWDSVIRTNLDSVFNMTKQVMDGMVDRGWGRVINVSSVNGSKGAFGQTNYSAAKAGMHGFTKALALEVARKGVTVNTISPGYIGTKMVTAIPKEVPAADPARAPRCARRNCGPYHLPVLGRGGVCDRRQYRDQRRPAHAITGTFKGLNT